MMQLALFDGPTGALMADYTGRAARLRFSSGEHGFQDLSAQVRMPLAEAYQLLDRPGLPHVVVSDNGLTIWEGRLEDVAIVPGGVRLTALGYWRALSDVPYTALWSHDGVADWRPVTSSDESGYDADKYSFDQLNRLYCTLLLNAVYSNGSQAAGFIFQVPNGGVRDIKYVTMSIAYGLPANWVLRFIAYDSSWGSAQTSNIDADGGSGSGTFTWDLSATPRAFVGIQAYNNTGGDYTNTGQNGAYYVRCTDVRVTTSGSTIYADEIAAALATYVNGINSAQLSASSALISSPAIDLHDEVYEDDLPSDILDRLARLGDNSTPVALYEVGVWDKQLVSFQKRGQAARQWYVDISELELERTIDALCNSAYATYQEAAGRMLRTAIGTDADSVARYGLTRRRVVHTDTTSSTQAGIHRDAALQDGKDPHPRIRIDFDALYDASGTRWPLWSARAWDTCTIRNLPPTLSTAIDRIRTFRIIESEYDADGDRLTLTPEQYLPTLETLVLRREAGIAV